MADAVAADTRKRIHAALSTVHHEQRAAVAARSPEQDEYLAYIVDKYGDEPPPSSEAAAAAAPSRPPAPSRAAAAAAAVKRRASPPPPLTLLEVGLRAGEQRIVIEPLDDPNERAVIPREDGYLPRQDGRRGVEYASEGPYGPHFMDEVRRRQELLEAHPKYAFLTLMAGAAGVPLTKLINIEHLEGRAIREEGRRRIGELEKKINEQNLQRLTSNRDEMERRLSDLAGGLQALQYAEQLELRRTLLENDAEKDVAALNDVEIRRRKYRQLQSFIVNWASNVHDPAGAAQDKDDRHEDWMTQFFDAAAALVSEADRRLLKDWLSGTELGTAVAALLVPLRELSAELMKHRGDGNTILLRDAAFTGLGGQLLDLLERYASLTYNARGQLETDRHRAGMAVLPVFDFTSGPLQQLAQPTLIGRRIEELDDNVYELGLQVAQAADDRTRYRKQQELENAQRLLEAEKRKLAATERQVVLPAVFVQRLRDALTALQNYAGWNPVERVTRARFFELFGNALTPVQRESILVAQLLERLTRTEQDIQQLQARRNAERAANEQAQQVLRKARQDLERLSVKVKEGQRAVNVARTELDTLQQRFYQHRYEWVQQPINSGIVALDEPVVRALNQALSLVRSAMNISGDALTLDALMDDEGAVRGDFAELAAVCYKIGYSTTGRSYTDRQVLGLNNASLNALVGHFRDNVHLGLGGKLIRGASTPTSVQLSTTGAMQDLYNLQRSFQQAQMTNAAINSRPNYQPW